MNGQLRAGDLIDVEAIRRFGFDTTIVHGEYVPALIHRIAAYAGESPAAITRWCQLNRIPTERRTRMTIEMTGNVAVALATAIGCHPLEIVSGTMGVFSEDAVVRGSDQLPAHAKNWTRGAGTRYCALCLRERPGVFMAHWRLWWSFLCQEHLVVLKDNCPACWSPIGDPNLMDRQPATPSSCRAHLSTGELCGHDLRDTWDETPYSPRAPIAIAQALLSVAWGRRNPGLSTEIADLDELLPTMRGIGIALLATGNVGLIARLASIPEGDIRGLFDESTRIGTSPPKNSLAMGALMGAATRLMWVPEHAVSNFIRRITFEHSRNQSGPARGPGSAATLISYWPSVGPRFRARVLRSLDKDLPAMQRLIVGSAARTEFDELVLSQHVTPPRRTFRADAGVPPLLWPEWTCPLDVAAGTDGETLQRSLALALRAAVLGAETLGCSEYEAPDAESIAGIGKQLRPKMLGKPEQTNAILRQLSELARFLRAAGDQIDYADRLRRPWWELLHTKHWRAIADSVGEAPGREKALLNARRYLFLRATAQPAQALPTSWKIVADRYDAADYTDFRIRMSAEMKQALDSYLRAWLERSAGDPWFFEGSDDPHAPVWVPPRWNGGDFATPGPELLDIDLNKLHDLVRHGITGVRALAREVGRTQNHVRWALQEHPAATGRSIQPIDWSDQLKTVARERWRLLRSQDDAVRPTDRLRAASRMSVWEPIEDPQASKEEYLFTT